MAIEVPKIDPTTKAILEPKTNAAISEMVADDITAGNTPVATALNAASVQTVTERGIIPPNLYHPKNVSGVIIATGNTIAVNANYRGYVLPVTPGEVYSVSRSSTINERFRVAFTNGVPVHGMTTTPSTSTTYDKSLKIENIVVPAGQTHMVLYLSLVPVELPAIKIERGPTATEIVPSPLEATEQVIYTRQRDILVNVKDPRFGATGSGTTDDTAAIQAAIDYAETNGGTVYFPPGRYLVNGTLLVPPRFSMTTWAQNTSPWGSPVPTMDSIIMSKGNLVFAEKPGVKDVYGKLEGVRFRAEASGGGSTSATLFGGAIEWRNAYINNISTIYYDKVFDTPFRSTSKIMHCDFAAVRGSVTSKAFVDSWFQKNYVNGYGLAGHLPVGMVFGTDTAHSTISNNFFDFLKYGIRLDSTLAARNDITGNIFDYCYQGIGASVPTEGSGATLTNSGITGNMFYRSSKTYMATYFSAPDAEMQNATSTWAGVWLPYGAQGANITAGNKFIQCDTGVRLASYPVKDFTESGNVYTGNGANFTYAASKSGVAGDQTNVYIGELDNRRHATLPNPTLTSTGGGIVTFDRQRGYYNGKPIWQDAGTWRDAMGAAVTA